MFGLPNLSPRTPPDPLKEAIRYFPRGNYSVQEVQSALGSELGRSPTLQELLNAFGVDPNFSSRQLTPTMRVEFSNLPFATENTPPYITVYDQSRVEQATRMTRPRSGSVVGGTIIPVSEVPQIRMGQPPSTSYGETFDRYISEALRQDRGGYQEARPTHGRRYLTFEEAGFLLQSGEVANFIADPQNQREVPPGNTRVTLVGIDGHEYDVLARYDPATNQVFPPTYQ